MSFSEKQLSAMLEEVQGYVNGINPIALRSAANLALRDYVRDVGGIEGAVEFPKEDDGSAARFSVWADAPFGGTTTAVEGVSVNGAEARAEAWKAEYLGKGAKVSFAWDTSGQDVLVKFLWEPTLQTREMPGDWFRAKAATLCDGICAKLLTQSGKPWADEAVGAQFMARYREEVWEDLRRRHMGKMDGGRLDVFDRMSQFAPGL